MSMLFTVAVLPAVVLMLYIYKKDKREKEPMRKLLLCFFVGILSLVPTIVLELTFSEVLEFFYEETLENPPLSYFIIDNFLCVALIEEFCKYIFLNKVSKNNKFFDCYFDGIVYSVFVSLGFATVENIMYAFDNGMGTAVLRMFSAVPGHMCFAVFMGYYYSQKRKNDLMGMPSGKLRRRAVLVPTFIHGTYDLLASLDDDYAAFGWLVFTVAVFIISFKLVNKVSKQDTSLVQYADQPNLYYNPEIRQS